VLRGSAIALGPGKADLLDAIRRRGGLRSAAAELSMSYMRAWKLVRTMNASFRDPLVELSRGGATGGGARLTAAGREVLALYRRIERAGVSAAAAPWKRLRSRLR
jgi:molybdate transport system regulatory protein